MSWRSTKGSGTKLSMTWGESGMPLCDVNWVVDWKGMPQLSWSHEFSTLRWDTTLKYFCFSCCCLSSATAHEIMGKLPNFTGPQLFLRNPRGSKRRNPRGASNVVNNLWPNLLLTPKDYRHRTSWKQFSEVKKKNGLRFTCLPKRQNMPYKPNQVNCLLKICFQKIR